MEIKNFLLYNMFSYFQFMRFFNVHVFHSQLTRVCISRTCVIDSFGHYLTFPLSVHFQFGCSRRFVFIVTKLRDFWKMYSSLRRVFTAKCFHIVPFVLLLSWFDIINSVFNWLCLGSILLEFVSSSNSFSWRYKFVDQPFNRISEYRNFTVVFVHIIKGNITSFLSAYVSRICK